MRLEISIPDPIYAEAQRAAQIVGLKVENFVTESLELRLQDDFSEPDEISLTPEQVAIIRRGQADIKAGKGLSLEQLGADLAENRAEWLRANRP